MVSSSKQKNSSHKCCAAVLCNNRLNNRPDLIFHNFPLDEKLPKIWDQKMKHGEKNLPRTAHSSVDCKTVRIFAYSSTPEQSNKRSGARLKTESETGERR